MSEYIEFITAPDDTVAAAVRNSGPNHRYPTVDATGIHFEADDAVMAWRDLLVGQGEPAGPRMVADFVNDGSAVFALPENLVAALATAPPTRLREAAERWVPTVVADGATIDPETATTLLSSLAELARTTDNQLYCWVAC
ncbi:hypothetical protein [Actinoplanes couchii]|uniref:Uncharacterized protein n=1 Tax=Actinoplanes couchii TaxID=403638 RepID=A0ABQ3XFH1_9ACTN|nr:hypothetical protein [Actinoplanes couchii]MDR6321790.1 hypothetical protein [Actinoplanes couchii]GID57252.1 hypothetical protein Aco03nite_056560 [Actinoplanes couchii]